jgi:tetraacyldisaccharide 4'-kinase
MTPFRYLLYPFAFLYGTATWLRNKGYDAGLLKSTSFPVPIICVGNLSTGGTGKSPHVQYLSEWLGKERNIAILSRGYGRRTTGYLEVDENGTPQEYGDEPLEIKRNSPEVLVVVCEDRPSGVERLLKDYAHIELIILDDGFQHRPLRASLNILLTPYSAPFSKDHLLPVGNLRELKSGSQRAQMVILTKVPDGANEQDLNDIKGDLLDLSGALVFSSSIEYHQLSPVFDESKPSISLDQIKGCLLLTGIADPSPLVSHLKRHLEKVEHIKWPDHHDPSRNELENARQKFDNFAGLEHIIITTEKDAMRLLSSSNKDVIQDLPVYYLKMRVKPLEEDALKHHILQYIGEDKNNS